MRMITAAMISSIPITFIRLMLSWNISMPVRVPTAGSTQDRIAAFEVSRLSSPLLYKKKGMAQHKMLRPKHHGMDEGSEAARTAVSA